MQINGFLKNNQFSSPALGPLLNSALLFPICCSLFNTSGCWIDIWVVEEACTASAFICSTVVYFINLGLLFILCNSNEGNCVLGLFSLFSCASSVFTLPMAYVWDSAQRLYNKFFAKCPPSCWSYSYIKHVIIIFHCCPTHLRCLCSTHSLAPTLPSFVWCSWNTLYLHRVYHVSATGNILVLLSAAITCSHISVTPLGKVASICEFCSVTVPSQTLEIDDVRSHSAYSLQKLITSLKSGFIVMKFKG